MRVKQFSDDLYTSRINGARFMNDPIVEEVRAAREAIAAKCKFDIHTLAENARRHQTKSGHKIIKIARCSNQKTRCVRD